MTTIVSPVLTLACDAVTDLVGIRAGREKVTPTAIPTRARDRGDLQPRPKRSGSLGSKAADDCVATDE
jgi:hypothetical protein